ncbi:DUF1330 domain-containing protein [Pelagibius sp.]|uniref:DUF1330 domain-containing protein n=1 Tax=Pelagibius sp. TaxID=1931238 RepID=UPI0026050E94|nr:DUF1330 domain-containing protein [Pelagibius sp.]
MVAFWIAHVTVTDEEVYGEYAKRATKAVQGHGGRFLARGGRHVTKEGTDHARNVVAEFPSFEAAVGCYESPEYQEALTYALRSSERHLSIVEGA